MVVSRVVAKVAIIYYYEKWCAKNAPGAKLPSHRAAGAGRGGRRQQAAVLCIHQESYKNMLEMIILSQSNCNQSEKGKYYAKNKQ